MFPNPLYAPRATSERPLPPVSQRNQLLEQLNSYIDKKQCSPEAIAKKYNIQESFTGGPRYWKDEVAAVIAGKKPIAATHFDNPQGEEDWDDEIAILAAKCGTHAFNLLPPMSDEPYLIVGSPPEDNIQLRKKEKKWKPEYEKPKYCSPIRVTQDMIWFNPKKNPFSEADATLLFLDLTEREKGQRGIIPPDLFHYVQGIIYGYSKESTRDTFGKQDESIGKFDTKYKEAENFVQTWRQLFKKSRSF